MTRRFTAGALPPEVTAALGARLAAVDAEVARHYPGDRPGQPIHTVYLSAAAAESVAEWGTAATRIAERQAGLLDELVGTRVRKLTRDTLRHRPIQDLRLDFEDGYGTRAETVEDRDALRAGQILAGLPSSVRSRGVRLGGLTAAEYPRTIRTLELVLEGAGGVPDGFVFTVPKLRAAEQAEVAVQLCEALESAHGLPSGALCFELQIETPQAVIGPDGIVTAARALQRCAGRCTGLHYGTYDYSAACGIAPQYQSLEHPVADHAKSVLQVAAAQTGVWVCDGSTQVLPVGSDAEVAAALRRHHRLVTRSLERGYYQGWDMHPGQLVTRWAATYAFFRAALAAAAPRIERYLGRLGGAVADEPATAQALATVVLRGVDCGAFTSGEITVAAPAATVEVLNALRDRRQP